MFEQLMRLRDKLNTLSDIPPLLFRLILSYGFYGPATRKINNFDSIAEWFGSMNFPLPTLSTYLVTITETAGFILLFLGLVTRLISVPLMFVMLVAIFAVHISNGFAAGDNGFEIPLYYFLMLFSLFITGPGRVSIDALIRKQAK
jgi:putative oxidoreductase